MTKMINRVTLWLAQVCTACMLGKHEQCVRTNCPCCGSWNG